MPRTYRNRHGDDSVEPSTEQPLRNDASCDVVLRPPASTPVLGETGCKTVWTTSSNRSMGFHGFVAAETVVKPSSGSRYRTGRAENGCTTPFIGNRTCNRFDGTPAAEGICGGCTTSVLNISCLIRRYTRPKSFKARATSRPNFLLWYGGVQCGPASEPPVFILNKQ